MWLILGMWFRCCLRAVAGHEIWHWAARFETFTERNCWAYDACAAEDWTEGGFTLALFQGWGMGSEEVLEQVQLNFSFRNKFIILLPYGLLVENNVLKTHIFESVLFSTRRPHGKRIMNLFRKLKFSCTCSNTSSLPIPHPWNKGWVKPRSVQSSAAHASCAQQIFSVNVSNRADQCQILWPATARKQQRDSHA